MRIWRREGLGSDQQRQDANVFSHVVYECKACSENNIEHRYYMGGKRRRASIYSHSLSSSPARTQQLVDIQQALIPPPGRS